MQLYAHLNPESRRAKNWLDTFGSLSVPILSPIPEARLKPASEDDDSNHLFFLVDVTKLTGEQKDRIVAHVAFRFHLRPDSIREDFFNGHGMPILADDDLIVTPWARHPAIESEPS